MNDVAKAQKMLKQARETSGLTQIELAAKSDVGFSAIGKIEQGRGPLPTVRIMHKLAKAFGMDYDPKRIRFVGRVGHIDSSGAFIGELHQDGSEESESPRRNAKTQKPPEPPPGSSQSGKDGPKP